MNELSLAVEQMLRNKYIKYLIINTAVLFGILYININYNSAIAVEDKEIIQKKQKELRTVAEKYAKAYAKRNYKEMYELLIPVYKKRVPLWEFKDFVTYPGVTDGYIQVEVVDVSILPKGEFKFGKVMLKIVITENQKYKTTGESVKVEREKWEFQDWVEIKGKWLKIEKYDS
ncbi:MAG: hypothetical protein HZA78_10060 [Candidatus Schekmanbacteria bacterium]|nr:hypothetical protein [Candidatus Schekmanbacteria bacterium]